MVRDGAARLLTMRDRNHSTSQNMQCHAAHLRLALWRCGRNAVANQREIHGVRFHVRDAFRYRISRDGASGAETVEVPETAVPTPVAACVKDTFI